MLSHYERDEEYRLERVWFDFLGARYEGRGVMQWKPDAGFHIHASVDRQGPPLPTKIEVPLLSKGTDGTHSPLRFVAKGLGTGRTSVFDLESAIPSLLDGWLSVTATTIKFSDVLYGDRHRDLWGRTTIEGRASLVSSADILLPDPVERKTRMGGRLIDHTNSLGGFSYEAGGLRLRIIARGKDLDLSWTVARDNWSARMAWSIADAVALSLGILSKGECQVLQCEADVGKRQLVMVSARRKLRKLSFLAPFLGDTVLDKSHLTTIVPLLARSSKEALVCRRIFEQIAEASAQRSWQAAELLVATILEAALRTLYNRPFVPGGSGINISQHLDKLCTDYLGDQWKPKCRLVLEAHDRLRHRNAHPDWLATDASNTAALDPVDDAILLCHFYGKVILALAGRKDIEALLPIPHRDWKPLLTISTAEDDGAIDTLS